ncbi:phage tail tape measure protein [Variovorax gossypii]
MSNTSFAVGVRIDGTSAGLKKAAQEANAQLRTLGVQSIKDGQQAHREFSRMANARQTLGIRSEREIQREIQRTQAAYNRLARSGTMSWEEQRRAARAMREEVTKLNNEMGRLTTRQRIARAGRIGVGVAAGVGTTVALAAPSVKRSLDYDRRLTYMANTAFAERDDAGRKSGVRELDEIVRDAVRFGGGTRDSAAETADALFGSGVFKVEDVKKILRDAQMAGVANNADPLAFAQMAVSANQTMGIKPERMGAMFGMTTKAGQLGGFEIKDMAKWLPQQMAAAKSVGMYGESGVAKLAAINQASRVTAGTTDEAGNNVVNLLAKIGSQDTAKDFKKIGVDLPKMLAQGRMRGEDALDVVGGLLDKQLSKNKNYQNVQKQLRGAKGNAERTEALSAVGDIAQGTVIGKVFQDRQALMALYAYMNSRGRVKEIAAESLAGTDAAERNMRAVRETPSFQLERVQQEKDMALQDSVNKMAPAIGSMSDKLATLMQKYPEYTTAIIAATGALAGLAGSAGALAALKYMTGGKGAPPVPSGIVPSGAANAGNGMSRFLGMGGKALGAFARAAGPLALIETLTGPSDEDIAALRRMDAEKARAAGGYRGKGFNDPRILGNVPTPTLSDRLGLPSGQPFMPAQPVGGEIVLRIIKPADMQVETETRSSNQRIPFRVDAGRSNPEMR